MRTGASGGGGWCGTLGGIVSGHAKHAFPGTAEVAHVG